MKKRKRLHKLGGILLAFGLLLSIAAPVKAAVTDADLENPKMDESTHNKCDTYYIDYKHYTEYDYVYFGSYPQREITGEELTSDIINAQYDENCDAVVNGKKYRRTTFEMGDRYGTINEYEKEMVWDPYATDGYRYFLYEPVKWRILNNDKDSGKLFLMSGILVDYRLMANSTTADTWETCVLREWLNYEDTMSEQTKRASRGVPGFYRTAFSDYEKEQILVTNVVQDVNPYYKTQNGNDTQDKIFLLSFEELTNKEYGFCKRYFNVGYEEKALYECGNGWDVGMTEYASAMTNEKKTYTDRTWRLRTAGGSSSPFAYAATVSSQDKYACINLKGWYYNDTGIGVVPAMNVTYNSSNCIRVTFETNGAGSIEEQILLGSGCAKEPVAVAENKLETKLNLQKEGYVFTGWYTDAGCTKVYNFNQVLTQDTTLYAGWKKPQDKPSGLSGGVLKIKGTTTAMEYSQSATPDAVWTTCGDQVTKVPSAGTWYVRYKGSDALMESEPVAVEVITLDQAAADFVKEQKIPESTVAITDKVIKNTKNEKDITGSSFARIQARADKVSKNSIRLKWNKVSKADGYEIYGNKCGKKNKYVFIKDVKNGKKTSYTHKKRKKGTYYKYIVRAYKLIEGEKVSIAVSKTIHASTEKGKYGNAKSVKIETDKKMKSKNNSYTLTIKKNKKYTIKASEVKQSKKIKKHRKIAFESTNSKIATVSGKGVVQGKKKGTCYIYAYAQNGVYKKIKVKVK